MLTSSYSPGASLLLNYWHCVIVCQNQLHLALKINIGYQQFYTLTAMRKFLLLSAFITVGMLYFNDYLKQYVYSNCGNMPKLCLVLFCYKFMRKECIVSDPFYGRLDSNQWSLMQGQQIRQDSQKDIQQRKQVASQLCRELRCMDFNKIVHSVSLQVVQPLALRSCNLTIYL